MADAAGAPFGINAYDAYGVPNLNNIGRFQYTGQAWLAELGVYYYKARMYSPTLGRFMQTDPIGYDDEFNLYAYVGDDPLNLADPTGTESAFITTYSACVDTGGSNCGAILEPYQEMGKAFPLADAAWEVDQGNYKTAIFLGALEVGTGGRGRAIGSLGSPLGRALAAVGRGAVKGLEQAHHIVPKAAMNQFAVQARAVLEKAGVGIHDAVNGIALPKAFHGGLHTLNYYRSVAGRLTSAFENGGAKAVKAELGKIGRELEHAAKEACRPKIGSRISNC